LVTLVTHQLIVLVLVHHPLAPLFRRLNLLHAMTVTMKRRNHWRVEGLKLIEEISKLSGEMKAISGVMIQGPGIRLLKNLVSLSVWERQGIQNVTVEAQSNVLLKLISLTPTAVMTVLRSFWPDLIWRRCLRTWVYHLMIRSILLEARRVLIIT
jgi:hypothetical protein